MKNLIIVSVMVFTSCGAQDNSSPSTETAPAVAAVAPSFEGIFNSDCKYMRRLTMKNTANISTLIIEEYLDDKCEKPRTTTTLVRNYKDLVKASDEIYAVDFEYVSIEMTIHVADAAPADSALYGYSDWEVGVAKDIAGRSKTPYISGLPSSGEVIYAVWKVQGEKYFSDCTWMISPIIGRTVQTRAIDALETHQFTKA